LSNNLSLTSCQREIKALFDIELRLLKELLASLKEERQALINQNADQLTQQVLTKQNSVLDLDELSGQLKELLTRYGFNIDSTGLIACLDWCAPDDQLSLLTDEVSMLQEKCQAENQGNSLYAKKSQELVSRTIDVLRGEKAAQPDLYEASGSTHAGSRSRILGKA